MRHQQVWLNNVDLASVHPSVLLQHINEGELKLLQRWNDRPGGGQMLLSNQYQQKEIIIEFAIRDGRNYDRRLEAFAAVCQWAAGGGWLEISSRPGQKIFVTLSQMPVIGRLREWTENMAIHFIAGWCPFWENVVPSTASGSGASGTINLFAPGNAQSKLSAIIAGSGLTSVTLSCPATDTALWVSNPSGLGGDVRIYHDDQNLLHITAGGVDVMRYRGGSDEVILNPGHNAINYSINTSASIQLIAGGAWM